jgi:hypothetical protein
VTISFGYILYCVCFNLYSGSFKLFCNVCVYVYVCVCVCVGFVMCGSFVNVYTSIFLSATLIEFFPCSFLSCKANARVKFAKTGHDMHSSKIVVISVVFCYLYCYMYCLCVNVYCTTATGC